MIIFPAIDILGGKAVRLKQGDYDQVTVYNDDPVAQAAAFMDAGAEWIHVVDLDGARSGLPANIDVVERIVRELKLDIEVGGGIRDMDTLDRLFEAGVSRAVIGTKLITDAEFVRQAATTFAGRIVGGVDARDGMVAIEGWREGTSTPAAELVAELAGLGIRHLVYTDISRDGVLTGINSAAYQAIAKDAGFPVVASGGVSSMWDVKALSALGDDVIEGVIIGRAIYEGEIELTEALALAGGGA